MVHLLVSFEFEYIYGDIDFFMNCTKMTSIGTKRKMVHRYKSAPFSKIGLSLLFSFLQHAAM
jgi:hypothetical protein